MNNELKNFLKDELDDLLGNNSIQKIDMFLHYLDMVTEDSEIDAADTKKILPTLTEYQQGTVSTKDMVNGKKILVVEPFLRTLCQYVDKKKSTDIEKSNEGFKELILWIGDYTHGATLGIGMEKLSECEKYDNPKKQWAIMYWARNKAAHKDFSLNNIECARVIGAVLYVMIASVWKYRNVLKSVVSDKVIAANFDRDAYLKRIIKEYEDRQMQKTFVEMKYVVYNMKDAEETSTMQLMNIFNEQCNYIKLIGEAGLGKSRLMKHLEYMDAKKNQRLPIYIELRDIIDRTTDIYSLIARRLKVNKSVAEEILKFMPVDLYLDGVNEMLCDDREKFEICRAIDSFVAENKLTYVLISDRENSEVTVSNRIPIFTLTKLNSQMANKFIDFNCPEKHMISVKNVLASFEKTQLITPIMLILLIQMIEQGEYNEKINSEEEFYKHYIQGLIRREVEEKGEFRARKIEYMLAYLASIDMDVDSDVHAYKEATVLSTFKACADTYGIASDMIEMLELVTQMGLLKRLEKDIYIFASGPIEDYFVSYAIEKGIYVI